MTLSDDLLMAYADGELDPPMRAQVEEAIASDPQAARRLAAHKALRAKLRSDYDQVLDEPVPERLVAAARATPSTRPARGVVVPLRPKRGRSFSWPHWGAIAASFVVGALVWHFGAGLYLSGPVTEQNGQLLASGALDRALSNRLASDQSPSSVQIGVSFRSKSGDYCRTFQLHERASLAGLACREQDKWKLEVLARGDASQESHEGYRQAASALPSAIVRTVDQVIDGDPLDAQGEANARTRQWRAAK